MTTTQSTFATRELRDVLGSFVTGVTVITTRDAAGKGHGVTANSFSSVSLDPPLVLWSQSVTSKSHPAFRDSEHFAIHILAEDQVDVSNHFARSHDDKLRDIPHVDGFAGVPVIAGCAAHLECTKVATYPGGDHVVYLGRVERISHSARRPLAFGAGKYMLAYAHDLGPVSLDFGSSGSTQVEAVRVATEALPAICQQVGQRTLCLAAWGNHGPVAIRWEPSDDPVSQNLRTGLVMSISRSATGRAFAAFLPEEATRTLIEEDLRSSQRAGEGDAVQRARFEADIADARRYGLARATEANASPLHQVTVNAFSAPIYDAHGSMVLALSLTCRADKLEPDWDGPVAQALLEGARALSCRLGGAAHV